MKRKIIKTSLYSLISGGNCINNHMSDHLEDNLTNMLAMENKTQVERQEWFKTIFYYI